MNKREYPSSDDPTSVLVPFINRQTVPANGTGSDPDPVPFASGLGTPDSEINRSSRLLEIIAPVALQYKTVTTRWNVMTTVCSERLNV